MATRVRAKTENGPIPQPDARPLGAQARERIPLDQITTRPGRTRDLNPGHVAALAESIAAIGLIHPPAVDRGNGLLAGAHRVAALRWLEEHARDRFLELFPDGVPVRRMDLDPESDADLAFAVETAENEQRRDYSPPEIQKLAHRLKAAGYHYSAEGGRPRADHRPLMPALEIIVGKSVRQLRRILNPPEVRETRTRDLVSDLKRFLVSTDRISARLDGASDRPELAALKSALARANRMAGRALAVLKP
jgi:ParB family chromosome partitioning protein